MLSEPATRPATSNARLSHALCTAPGLTLPEELVFGVPASSFQSTKDRYILDHCDQLDTLCWAMEGGVTGGPSRGSRGRRGRAPSEGDERTPGASSGQGAGGAAPVNPEKASEPESGARESLSGLTARILQQLSISAWLPAGSLVFIALLYGSLANNQDDLGKAITAIGSINIPSLTLLFGAVVLLTIATQAFEFEAIRLLEGYWGTGLIRRGVTGIACGIHIWRRDRLQRIKDKLQSSAFAYARQEMLETLPLSVVNDVEAYFHDPSTPRPDDFDPKDVDWRQFARSGDVRRLNDDIRRLEQYPTRDYRVLPTQLGNTLRVSEEIFHDPTTGSMEGMMLRVFDELPEALKNEHDRYRGRLDVYCSMVVVFVLGALAAGPVLFRGDWRAPVVAVVMTLSLAIFSYRAAIVSARHYGTVLETVHSRLAPPQ